MDKDAVGEVDGLAPTDKEAVGVEDTPGVEDGDAPIDKEAVGDADAPGLTFGLGELEGLACGACDEGRGDGNTTFAVPSSRLFPTVLTLVTSCRLTTTLSPPYGRLKVLNEITPLVTEGCEVRDERKCANNMVSSFSSILWNRKGHKEG
jgi:hypothetical protein